MSMFQDDANKRTSMRQLEKAAFEPMQQNMLLKVRYLVMVTDCTGKVVRLVHNHRYRINR